MDDHLHQNNHQVWSTVDQLKEQLQNYDPMTNTGYETAKMINTTSIATKGGSQLWADLSESM